MGKIIRSSVKDLIKIFFIVNVHTAVLGAQFLAQGDIGRDGVTCFILKTVICVAGVDKITGITISYSDIVWGKC